MKLSINQYAKEINQRFNSSWKKLALITENNEEDSMLQSIKHMHTSMKWSLAYTAINNYCGNIIKPYTHHYSLIIKQFWIEYIEDFFMTNVPPTPQSFFEWYCDSRGIKEEQRLVLLASNS